MPSEDKLFTELTVPCRLLELARQTKRYSIRERQPGQLEVIDERHLLDRLLRLPELRPTTRDLVEIFDEGLEGLSSGPTLTLHDRKCSTASRRP